MGIELLTNKVSETFTLKSGKGIAIFSKYSIGH